MAFTNTPVVSTYNTHKIGVDFSLNPRIGADLSTPIGGSYPILYDGGLVNLLPVVVTDAEGKTKIDVETRPPLLGSTVTSTSSEAVLPRGCYVWQKDSTHVYYFAVFNTKVYTSTDGTTWTAVTTLLTSASTPVGFTEFIDDVNTKSLILVDGIEGYVFTSNAAGTKIVDVDFPSPHVPYPIYIDGYLFLAKKDTGDIYNSDLNLPATWSAGSFISSELYPDDIQALAKINNYLVAVGTEGCEYFYDAANATASPLARQESLALPFGTPAPYTIAVNKNTMVMLAQSSDGQMYLKHIEDNKADDIDCTWLLRFINNQLVSVGSTVSVNSLRGYFMRLGHDLFYVLTVPLISTANPPYIAAFAYSFKTKMWVMLSYAENNGTYPSYWPVFGTSHGSLNDPITFVMGCVNSKGFFGTFGTSKLYGTSFTSIQSIDKIESGVSSNIICILQTPTLSFETLNRKFMSRMGINTTFGRSGASVTYNVYWADEDNAFPSVSPNTTMSVVAGEYPFLNQLGSFRRRVFRLVWQSSTPCRVHELEFDINKGQQ